ncbi:MAG: FAD-dependent oxidoreductase [Phycisphaerae bacterium]|nr:FAD-dependent oxidoreductase [Phycisphaerae bacterium]
MDHSCDILIIGAGPAGLHAARAASRSTRRPSILLVDENPSIGGQIWRRGAPAWAGRLLAGANACSISYLSSTTVLQRLGPRAVLASTLTPSGRGPIAARITFDTVILATGARELFLPFPGWTLPGVVGAGGAQALVKSGLDVTGKRMVVAGSGPLLLAVAGFLRSRGALVAAIAEQAPPAAIRRFALSLAGYPTKAFQGLMLRARLASVPYWTGAWPIRATGTDRIERVTIRRGDRDVEIPCDLLACGFGLVPSIHLAAVMGCEIRDGRVVTDDLLTTTAPHVLCAGEANGIGGVECAAIEGEMAGLAAAGMIDPARRLLPARARARRFAALLDSAFAPRSELSSLASPDTILCRCEDVTTGEVKPYTTWREAKIHARCGMGSCQGRVCGPIARYLFGLDPGDARPPAAPVDVAFLAAADPGAIPGESPLSE